MKKQKTEGQHQRIDAIIHIAHELFKKNGYELVGIREICQVAGLSPTQLYRLGLTKQNLLAEVILHVNATQIQSIQPFSNKGFQSASAYVEKYLINLYELDIKIKSIRAESAAFGWKWSGHYEALIIKQVLQLMKPIADALEYDGYGDIQARCFAIWSLYYVGYRHAVIQEGGAQECFDLIRPSLELCLKK